MRKTNEAQLPLLALPEAARPRRRQVQRPMPPALIAKHCNALLSELDRIALEADARATHLARLFTAVERAHEERSEDRRASSVA